MKRKRMMVMVRLEGSVGGVTEALAEIKERSSEVMIINSMEYEI